MCTAERSACCAAGRCCRVCRLPVVAAYTGAVSADVNTRPEVAGCQGSLHHDCVSRCTLMSSCLVSRCSYVRNCQQNQKNSWLLCHHGQLLHMHILAQTAARTSNLCVVMQQSSFGTGVPNCSNQSCPPAPLKSFSTCWRYTNKIIIYYIIIIPMTTPIA